MTNILKKIAEHKREEIDTRQQLYPIALLEKSPFFETTPVSLKKYLLRTDKSGIIAEFKRRSPSRGMINAYAQVDEVTIGYMRAGASALSILTDREFFGGSSGDLTKARELNYCPILRKDFIIDPYQVIEAKSLGADAILLIASLLTPEITRDLASLARSLGMETLLEVHNEGELEHRNEWITLIGINNRNLNDFTVTMDTSERLSRKMEPGDLFVAESGIKTHEDILRLKGLGYKGFLIGELFMAASNPAAACQQFINQCKKSA